MLAFWPLTDGIGRAPTAPLNARRRSERPAALRSEGAMERLQGIAVSPGVAIGEALILDNEGFRIPRRFVQRDAVDAELTRLGLAIEAATGEVDRNRARVATELGDEYAAIFSAHLQMLNDRRLRQELDDMIRTRHYSPEYSVSRALGKY